MKKVLNYGKTWEIVADQNLLQLQKDTSSFMKIELDRIGKETGIIDGQVRGYGTHLGFDCQNETMANSLQRWFFATGIQALKCGPRTFGLRPSLTLGVFDAAQLRDNMLAYHPNFENGV